MTFLIFYFLLSVDDELLMNVTEIRRLVDMVKIITLELTHAFIKEQVGDKKVLLALSGGVDSSVVAPLLIKAIAHYLVCVHVNHGLFHEGELKKDIKAHHNAVDYLNI